MNQTSISTSSSPGIALRGYRARRSRERRISILLLLFWAAISLFLLLVGDKIYTPRVLFQVLTGAQVKGATYAIQTIRLPRVLIGTLAGFSFGCAGNVFQRMLRNSLASPDVMGITSGASASAVFAMMVLGLHGMALSVFALAGGILAATLILVLSRAKPFSVNRMILTGIGIQAILQAIINFIILKTSDYNISDALRWLSGSLNGVRLSDVLLFAPLVLVCVSLLLILEREIEVLRLGEELPLTLGARPELTRGLILYLAVFLCAGTTAVTGPLSSVAFMSGPIASRLNNTGGIGTMQAGMVGALIVLFGEAIGQFATGTRYPVGVITGILGAPYLVYLLTVMNRRGR